MRRLHAWRICLWNLFRRRGLEREMDAEIRFHLEQEIGEKVAGGMSREAATREAQAAFGSLPLLRDRARDAWGWSWLDDLWRDLRLSARMLARSPMFTLTAVVTLALGIGANTAIFGLTNVLLFKPLYERPHEVVGVFSRDTTATRGGFRPFSYPEFRDLRARSQSFASLSAFGFALVGITEGDLTRRAMAFVVSAGYFDTFGRPPAMGRAFATDEDRPGADVPVAVVSHAHWVRTGRDPDVLGRTLRINGRPFTIVGVAPEGFTGAALMGPEVWVPIGVYQSVAGGPGSPAADLGDPATRTLAVAGRLRPGVARAAADAELATVARYLQDAFPATSGSHTVVTGPLARASLGTAPESDSGTAVLATLLMSASLVVLLVACLNLAGLLVARGYARRHEMAVRMSLGGGRRRLVRQLLTEGVFLALAGGAAGLLVSTWVVDALIASLAPVLPMSVSLAVPGIDWRVVAATVGFCVLACLFFSAGPAWTLTRPAVLAHLRHGPGQQESAARGRLRGQWLVVTQVALSVALLAAGGLFLMSVVSAARWDPGFDPAGALLVEVDPGLAGYDEARGRATYRALLDRVRALPGVEAAGIASRVPLSVFSFDRAAVPAGTTDPDANRVSARYVIAGGDYLPSLGLPLLRGRDFAEIEMTPGGPAPVAIVNEAFVERLWPGEDGLGRQFQFAGSTGPAEPPLQIVGIVPDVKYQLWELTPFPVVYVPFGYDYASPMTLLVRASETREEVEPRMLDAVAGAVRAADDRLPVLDPRRWQAHREVNVEVVALRMGAAIFAVFAAAALLLTVIGVYGVKAYLVSRRTREFGIRLALGAAPRDVRWLVLREGTGVTLAGIAVGLIVAAGAGQVLQNFLFGIRAVEPLVLVVAPIVLLAASLLASYVPARRATQVDPMVALRTE